jgi:protein-S-isoprenylcysteine O-methyltransferase Ste14
MFLSADAVAKTVWLSITAIGVCLATIPPQPKPPKEFQEKFHNPPTVSFEKSCSSAESPWLCYQAACAAFTLSYFPYLFSTWVVFMHMLDAIHTLDLFPQLMPVSHTITARTFNTQLIAGLMFTTAATALRFAAFHTLGKLFTFQLAILPEHKLITHGVYAYCRHPSYTATPFIFWGVLLTITAPGSVLYDRFGVDLMMKVTTVLALAAARGSYVLVGRAELEDQVLRKEFGKDWEEWVRMVPYKFIPYVF